MSIGTTIKTLRRGRDLTQEELAEILGVDREYTAAIGDYYNDWDMLKSVGFPACAGQAPKPIHDICKYVACHCNKGCVADLLRIIMSGKAKV